MLFSIPMKTGEERGTNRKRIDTIYEENREMKE